MKCTVLALDYDGTIARSDTLDPIVRQAIADARAAGITVLLVTGRILEELRRVAGSLHFLDGVVAENGAVVHFPDSGHTSLLAPPIPAPFVAELSRRGLHFRVGACLVDAQASDGPVLTQVIREMELPLVLLFNRSRVMVLGQGISKATGLQTALEMIRASARNTVAVGDAENDHELLRLAEVGTAVSWGSASLVAAADIVVAGEGPSALGPYITALARSGRLPQPPRARRRLHLGYTEDGRDFSLAVRGRNVLVAGDAKSGKSWVAGLLCEQLILQRYCVCVIDPEGDYRSLEALPGVTVLGGEDPPPNAGDVLRALRYPDRSIVIDLSRLPLDEKVGYIRALLPALTAIRRRTGLPHRVLLDEAHYFLQERCGVDPSRHLLDLEQNGYIIVTYRASRLPPELLAHTEVMIVTCESDPAEIEALKRRCTACAETTPAQWLQLPRLGARQAVVLPTTEEAGGTIRLFTIGGRLTPHVRHREKYVDVPVSETRAFVFRTSAGQAKPARTLREFVAELEHTEVECLDGYLQRGDFSRWVGDIFGDRALAEDLRTLETRYRSDEDGEAVAAIVNAVRSRYDLTDDVAPVGSAPGGRDP